MTIEIDASDYDHFSETDFVLARDPVLWAFFESLPLFDASAWLDCAECNSPDTEIDPSAFNAGEPCIVCRTCGAVTEGR